MKNYKFTYRHFAHNETRKHSEALNNIEEAKDFARGLRAGGAYRIEIIYRNKVVASL